MSGGRFVLATVLNLRINELSGSLSLCWAGGAWGGLGASNIDGASG